MAVAADFARRGTPQDPQSIVLTASTSEAYALLFKLLCDPGDTVLTPRPSYPLFAYLGDLEGVALRQYPLSYDGRWQIDFSALANAVSDDVRAVIAVSPNNPTGSYLKRDEQGRLLELCADRDVAVICDEVFADYGLRPDASRAPGLPVDGPALGFALGGLSKSVGLPQLKLAWIAVRGPRATRDEALARLEIIADTYLSVSTPIQLALPGLLARHGELQGPIRERVQTNLLRLSTAALGTTATLLDVEGGWSAIVRLPATRTDEEWALSLLEEQAVVVHPGYFFDIDLPACVVVSLLPPTEVFAAGVSRILGSLADGDGVE